MQIKLSEHQHPIIVVPTFDIIAGIYFLYQCVSIFINVFVIFRVFINNGIYKNAKPFLEIVVLLISLVWNVLIVVLNRVAIFRNPSGVTYTNLLLSKSHNDRKARAWPNVVEILLIYLMAGCLIFGPVLPFVLRFFEMDFWLLIFRQLDLDLSSTFNNILSFLLSLV